MKKTTLFRKYVLDEEILIMPIAPDALTAKIAQNAGFKAISRGGATGLHILGQPDVDLSTLTELAEWTGKIVDAVDIPVFADADTGYGNVTNVVRTVQLFEKMGVAGLFIEDQVSPKRCGHTEGKELISVEEMAAKLKAAIDSGRYIIALAYVDTKDGKEVTQSFCESVMFPTGPLPGAMQQMKGNMDEIVQKALPEAVDIQKEVQNVWR